MGRGGMEGEGGGEGVAQWRRERGDSRGAERRNLGCVLSCSSIVLRKTKKSGIKFYLLLLLRNQQGCISRGIHGLPESIAKACHTLQLYAL
jgi:hypothetical protein